MKNLATKTLIVLLGLISLALAGLIFIGFTYIKNKSISTSDTVRKVEESSNNSILAQSINSSGNSSANEIDKLDNLALSQEKLVNFIETLEGLGRNMNVSVKIVSVNSEPGKGEDSPDKIYFKIEALGNWSGTMQFLHAIESLPYRTMINNSNLSLTNGSESAATASSTNSQKKTWKLSTDLSAYSFK